MTVLLPPVALQNVSTLNADDFRGLIEALVPTEGVIASGDLAVTANGTPNMTVNCAAGAAVIVGDDTPATQGSYFVKNDGVVNLAIAAADPTNPRKDLIILQVRDSFYSGANDDARLAVVTGTPGASPAEPTLPNNSLKLAVVTVAAAASSITSGVIVDSRPQAAGIASIPNTAWTDYTPTLKQGATTVAKTVVYARYQRFGRMITAAVSLLVTGTGSSNGIIEVGIPVAAARETMAVGVAEFYNESTDERICAIAEPRSGAALRFHPIRINSNNYVGQSASEYSLLDADDTVTLTITYEAAT